MTFATAGMPDRGPTVRRNMPFMTAGDTSSGAESNLALAAEQDRHSQDEWEAATAAVLRKARRLGEDDPDATVWDKLTHTTLDGIAITPLGVAGCSPTETCGRDRAGAWDIRSRISRPEAKLANEEALVDLDGGVTSLWVAVDETPTSPHCWTACSSTWRRSCSTRPLRRSSPRGHCWCTPTSADSTSTPTPTSAPIRSARCSASCPSRSTRPSASCVTWPPGEDAGVRAIVVDATAAHDLGASDVQELAWSIAVGVADLRWLTDARSRSRRRREPDRVPLRRDGRAVPDHRQAPCCAPAVGERAPALRGAGRRRRGTAPARGDQPADAEQVRPLRQHASRHRRGVRRRCRRRRRGDRAAVRRGARPARGVRPSDRPQRHPSADRRVPRRRGRRPGRWCVRRRAAHGDLAAAGVGSFRQPRGRVRGRLRPHPVPRADRGTVAERERRDRPPQAADRPVSPSTPTSPRSPHPTADPSRRSRCAATAPRSRRCATSPPGSRSSWPRSARSPSTPHAPTFVSNLFAAGGIAVEVAGPTSGVDELLAAYDGEAGRLPRRHRRGLRGVGRGRGGGARGARRPARDPRRQARRRGRGGR